MKLYSKAVLFVALFAVSCGLVLAQETGGVKGKVRTARGESLAQVSVAARQNGNELKTVQTNSNGEFVLEGLPAGFYNFTFSKNGYASGIRYNVEVKSKKIRDLGSRLVLNVDQGTQVIIKGIVFDENGRSVRGANIDIEKKQADGSYKKVGSTTSSYGLESLATGEFDFRLPEGAADFRIIATMKGVSASKEITVNSAAVYRLALTLKADQK
jgi:hypothetical protein